MGATHWTSRLYASVQSLLDIWHLMREERRAKRQQCANLPAWVKHVIDEPVLVQVVLHPLPVPSFYAQAAVLGGEESLFPRGDHCAWCRRAPSEVREMWSIEFCYRLQEKPLSSLWCYACSPNHAVQYMLCWWDERRGGLYAG